jgi:uncharacterized membrane protein
MALVVGAIGGAMSTAVSYLVRRRQRRVLAAERASRIAREDAAWRRWCEVASIAVGAGSAVPPWLSPSRDFADRA